MSLQIIDFVFIVILAALTILGGIKGFINCIMGKIVPLLALWIASMTFGNIVPMIEKNITNHYIAVVLAFVIVFVVCFVVLKIVQALLKSVFSLPILKSLDRFLGFVFGFAEGLAVICLLLIVICIQPFFTPDELVGQSIFFKYLENVVRIPLDAINSSVSSAFAFINGYSALNV